MKKDKTRSNLPVQAQVEMQGQAETAKGLPSGEMDLGRAFQSYRRATKFRFPFTTDSVKQI